jgi:hypothetical protein
MKTKKIIILLIILLAGKILLDLTFKIKYTDSQLYEIKDFAINDSIKIDKGIILVGTNIKGSLEAFIFPNNCLMINQTSTVEYVYLRFYPEWFTKNLSSHIEKRLFTNADELVLIGQALHESNFKRYMHFGNYPIIKNDFIRCDFKIKESGEKMRMEIEVNK